MLVNKPIYIPINADGMLGDYLLLIVLAPTHIYYTHQCGGYSCDQKRAEGFLVPVGVANDLERLNHWFELTFGGFCMDASVWDAKKTESLARIIAKIQCWHSDEEGNDQVHYLKLDRSRMSECIEAWIPVLSPYGAGILVLANSD